MADEILPGARLVSPWGLTIGWHLCKLHMQCEVVDYTVVPEQPLGRLPLLQVIFRDFKVKEDVRQPTSCTSTMLLKFVEGLSARY